ncbi:unnamed protein product, partial [Polarella glacialis]
RCSASRSMPVAVTAVLALQHGEGLALFVSAFFSLREVCVVVRGEPPSALSMDGSVRPRFGDCLPSNALLGGQFRLDKTELEETGRAVFVPARMRRGLSVASGLALCSHLVGSWSLRRCLGQSDTPWWLLGTLGAVLGRKAGDAFELLRGAVGGAKSAAAVAQQPRRGAFSREVPRLLCRSGELWWMWCCLRQLQACESGAEWLAACSAA